MRALTRDPSSRADHEYATAFICGIDARDMQTTQIRYQTTNDPQPSAAISRAGAVLADCKRAGTPFDAAWEEAVREVKDRDLGALKWARATLEAAYENRSGGPLALAAVEV